MPLCGSSRCGCALVSVPAITGEINGALPTIDVAGNGAPASPWNLTLNDEWATEVAAEVLSGRSRGAVGYAERTTNQTGITAAVDIAGVSVTWVATAARRYRISAYGLAFSTVANDSLSWLVTDASESIRAQATASQQLASVAMTFVVLGSETGLSGTVTRKLRVSRLSGTGSISVFAGASYPTSILVEDIGPA